MIVVLGLITEPVGQDFFPKYKLYMIKYRDFAWVDSRRSRPKIILNIVTSSVKMLGPIIIMRFCCLLLGTTQDPC